ncbi:MAG: hypothetical protein COB39_13140 [Marinosulfonomonas sp.]|nr:MAG: hypothetical protein COB39_13140 [Marinosulfonomonas sp.]
MYKQIEVEVWASVSSDEEILELFRNWMESGCSYDCDCASPYDLLLIEYDFATGPQAKKVKVSLYGDE